MPRAQKKGEPERRHGEQKVRLCAESYSSHIKNRNLYASVVFLDLSSRAFDFTVRQVQHLELSENSTALMKAAEQASSHGKAQLRLKTARQTQRFTTTEV